MNRLQYLSSYIQSSTRKREIMDEETARLVTFYCTRFFTEIDTTGADSITLRLQLRSWVHDYRTPKGEELAMSTKRNVAGYVGRYCKNSGYMTKDDFAELMNAFRPKKSSWSEKALSDENVNRILSHMSYDHSYSFSKTRDLLATMFMLTVGLRIRQIIELKAEDVTEDENTIYIRATLLKKSSDATYSIKQIPKRLSFNGTTIIAVFNEYKGLMKESLHFFHNRSGQQITTNYYQWLFGKIEKAVHFSVSPHSFRHTAGTRIASKVGIVQAATVLDHTDIRTTQNYVSTAAASISDIISKAHS